MSGLPNIQENNTQILQDIQKLQNIEQQLFSSLETNPGLSSDQQQEIIRKISEISNMRVSLYETLGGVNSYFQNALQNSRGTLTEQTAAISIVEQELNASKKRLEILKEEKNNKIRLVQNNNYYGDRYAEHSELMKIIIYTLIPVIILVFLNSKSILPDMIYYILLTIVAIIGSIFLWRRYFSIISRDNMVYDEYNWYFDAGAAPKASGNTTDPWANNGNLGTCVGQACCIDGMIYDDALNTCVFGEPTTESFVNQNLTKPYFASMNKKPDAVLGGNNVEPMNSRSFINYK